MVCKKCGNNIANGSSFCNICGSEIVDSNISTKGSGVKILPIIGIVVLVIAVIIVLLFSLVFDNVEEKNQNEEHNKNMSNLSGTVLKMEEDGDYAKYSLKIDNLNLNAKYDFEIDKNNITIEFRDEDDFSWTTYVDGNKILDDADLTAYEPDYFEIVVYKLGDYLILANHDFTYIKHERIYIVNSLGKIEKILYDMTGDCLIYSEDFEIGKDGITLKADRNTDIEEYVCTTKIDAPNYAWDSADVDLCDRSSWPEGFENQLYQATYKFKYENGILDTNGEVIDYITINDYVSRESFGCYYAE